MFKKEVISSQLAYKKDSDAHQDEEDEPEEMGVFQILGRILILPIAVPVFMVYITFFAKGTPIASELDNLDNESDDESYSSDDDYRTTWEQAVMAATVFQAYICCKKTTNTALDASHNSLSYEAFMTQKSHGKIEDKIAKLYKYEPVVDVARTDRIDFEEDGVFIKNLWVPLNDIETMERLLEEIENQALQEEDETERDEWDARPSVKGEAKKAVQDLLHKAKNRQGIYPNSLLKKKTMSSKVDSNKVVSPGKSSPSSASPSPAVTSTNTISTPQSSSGTIKKNKPKKVPYAEGTPLSERMNIDHVASSHQVDGPSVDLHVPVWSRKSHA